MQRGGKYLAAAAAIAVVGCSGSPGKLEIRSAGAPLSAAAKPVSQRIAEARGHLALGNAALALEAFRKAAREQPDSVEALAGMAACYDAITRHDLSRRYYEAALALAPADTSLLAAFARSLELQGKTAEAIAVRKEIQMRLAAATPRAAKPAPPVLRAQAPQAAPAVAAPAAVMPAPVAQRAKEPPLAQAAPVPRAAQPRAAQTLAMVPPPSALAPPKAAAPTAAMEAPKLAPVPQPVAALPVAPALGPTVTVALPPAKPAPAEPRQARPVSAAAVIAAEPPRPKALKATRLERLSLGEVALVTSAQPQWRAQVVERKDRSTTIRFVPLRTAQARFAQARPPIRLLNAARYRGLAARTRSFLEQRGWRQLAIGDANRVREKSLILYPAARRATAERLAAQFGFPVAKRASGSELLVLLGRDAYRRPRRSKG